MEMRVKATMVERGGIYRSSQSSGNLTTCINLQNQHHIMIRDVGTIGGVGWLGFRFEYGYQKMLRRHI